MTESRELPSIQIREQKQGQVYKSREKWGRQNTAENFKEQMKI